MAFDFRVVAAGIADIGRTRKHNEDTVLLRPDLDLFMLADGAGGHEAGNVASALAVTTVAHHFEATKKAFAETPDFDTYGLSAAARRLSAAIHQAHHEIVEVAKASGRHKGMGTTFVGLWLEPRSGMAHVAHVGDSRCYRIRNGRIDQLTHDHSMINEVLEMRPDIEQETLAKLPRHVVTRALGMTDPMRVELRTWEPAAGDRYMLCSDGLHTFVPPDQIAEAFAIERTGEEQARLLIEMAKDAGSRDNVSAVVIECDPIPEVDLKPEPTDERPRKSAPMRLADGPSDQDEGSPEIVVLEEFFAEGPFSEHLHVVPAATKSRAVIDAVDGFIGPMRPKKAPER